MLKRIYNTEKNCEVLHILSFQNTFGLSWVGTIFSHYFMLILNSTKSKQQFSQTSPLELTHQQKHIPNYTYFCADWTFWRNNKNKQVSHRYQIWKNYTLMKHKLLLLCLNIKKEILVHDLSKFPTFPLEEFKLKHDIP